MSFQALIKWQKSIWIIISLEAIARTVIARLLARTGITLILVIIIFPFFVREALILLTALLKILRATGITHTEVLF